MNQEKVYSGIDQIPSGQASQHLTPGCLVLEGGAFKGLYTQGMLDAFMQQDLNLQCVIGVSAGALSGINYVSGQIGRSARVSLTYRHDPRYVGVKALRHSRSIVDVSFLTEDRGIYEPLNEARFYWPEQRYLAVATNCITGEWEAFEKGKCGDIMKAAQASATLPYLSPMVEIDGVPYLDGGCACKIPYQWALDEGFEKIIVIRTREVAFRKKNREDPLAEKIYRKYPQVMEKIKTMNLEANREFEEVEKLHAEGRLMRIAPSQEVLVSRLERDMEKLGDLYWLGYKDGTEKLPEIREYLEG
ncbi:MAG: patatin family protein [Clostridia bacterium]|nr:patatin family protein [Clostridia bacterium]